MNSFYCSRFLVLNFLLLVVSQHIACNLQQRASRQQRIEMKQQQEIIRSDSFNLDWRAQHFYQASESSRVQAVVIPEGVFQYSPGQGYTGRASRVIIQQSHNHLKLNRDSNRLQWTTVGKVTENTKQQVQETHREQVKAPVGGWKIALSLSLVLVLMVFVFFYFRRR